MCKAEISENVVGESKIKTGASITWNFQIKTKNEDKKLLTLSQIEGWKSIFFMIVLIIFHQVNPVVDREFNYQQLIIIEEEKII